MYRRMPHEDHPLVTKHASISSAFFSIRADPSCHCERARARAIEEIATTISTHLPPPFASTTASDSLSKSNSAVSARIFFLHDVPTSRR